SRTICRRSRPRSKTDCRMIRHPLLPPPTRKRTTARKTARAADRGLWGLSVPALVEEGRAKVNLTLRVIGRRTDGYHDLESLVAFADCADRLTLAPGHDLKLTTTGPLAGECGETSDNLVLRAALLLAERVPGLKL